MRLLTPFTWGVIAAMCALPGVIPRTYAQTPGTEKWHYAAPGYSTPAISPLDGTIYVGSTDHKLYAITPGGSLKWAFTTGGEVWANPTVAPDGTIYVGSKDGKLYAITPGGAQKWAYQTRLLFGTTPQPIIGGCALAKNGNIYFGGYDIFIYALSPSGAKLWDKQANAEISSSPSVGADGTVYISENGGRLFAISPTGTTLWTYGVGTAHSSPAIAADGTIYVGSDFNGLRALNPNGTLKWNYIPWYFQTYDSAAVDAYGTIYSGNMGAGLAAINPTDGSEKWFGSTDGYIIKSSPAIAADGTVYIGTLNGKVHAFTRTGGNAWSTPFAASGAIYSSPTIGKDGTVYVQSVGGNLYAINGSAGPAALAEWSGERKTEVNQARAGYDPFLINVDLGPNGNQEVGFAATGQTVDDVWNVYSGAGLSFKAMTNLSYANGSVSPVALTVANAPGLWGFACNDDMYDSYVYPNYGSSGTVSLTNVPAGRYDLYLYSADGNCQVTAEGINYGTKTTADPNYNPPPWTEGYEYMRFRDILITNSGDSIVITLNPGVAGWAIIAGLQLKEADPLLINVDLGPGSSQKVGLAATGYTTSDVWNTYSGAGVYSKAMTNLLYYDGLSSKVGMVVANAPGIWGASCSDPMYESYIYPWSGDATITVTNLPMGQYDFYVYSADGNCEVSAGGINYGTATSLDPGYGPPWVLGEQYMLFRTVAVTAPGQSVTLTIRNGVYGYAIVAGLQIKAVTQ